MARQPLVGQGLIIEIYDHSRTNHTRKDTSRRVISPTHRPLPDNTQRSKETNIHAPAGFKPAIPASEPLHTQALNRVATGIGAHCYLYIHYKAT